MCCKVTFSAADLDVAALLGPVDVEDAVGEAVDDAEPDVLWLFNGDITY